MNKSSSNEDIGWINDCSGNNSPVLRNDLSQINDELLKIQAIDKSMHEKFYQKYLS